MEGRLFLILKVQREKIGLIAWKKNLREGGFLNVEVINVGVIGHTALESVGRLFTEGYACKPDFVLIYHAWNDIKYFSLHQTVLMTLRPSI